jgi:hypothetical protein
MEQSILAKVTPCLHDAAISAEAKGFYQERTYHNLRKDSESVFCTES